MAIDVDPETGAARAVATGVLSLEDMKAAALAVWNHPDFKGMSVLFDLRESSFSLSVEETRGFSHFATAHTRVQPSGRTAFVVAADLEFGLVRMFGAFREEAGMQVDVFRDYGEALRWLETGERPRGL